MTDSKPCLHCKTIFYRNPGSNAGVWRGRKFCSDKCRVDHSNDRLRGEILHERYLAKKKRYQELRYGEGTKHLDPYIRMRFA